MDFEAFGQNRSSTHTVPTSETLTMKENRVAPWDRYAKKRKVVPAVEKKKIGGNSRKIPKLCNLDW